MTGAAPAVRPDAQESAAPEWFAQLFDGAVPVGREAIEHDGRVLTLRDGIVRIERASSAAQAQTSTAFGYKWGRRETYESLAFAAQTRAWLIERYGDPANASWLLPPDRPCVLLDAGCGSGFTALALFGDLLRKIRYVGADISSAVDVAARRFAERGMPGRFIQSNLMELPLREASVDVIYSEGVLHHTDSTRAAIARLARLLRPGGRMMFYVYRRKGPIREFTDDSIRERLEGMPPEKAWEALMPLTRLGQVLGDLKLEIDIPEDISLLDIPAGKIDLQRFFYWHVCKAFYRPEMTPDEMNHINFDWFAPRNSHRQSPEEVRAWCAEAGMSIDREQIEPAGITVIARKDAT